MIGDGVKILRCRRWRAAEDGLAFEEEGHLIAGGKEVIVRIEFCGFYGNGNSFYGMGRSAKGEEACNSAH